MSTFITRGTCSKAINFDIEDGKVANDVFCKAAAMATLRAFPCL